MNLSKSQYTKYRSCPKRLWLYRNKKEVLTPPDAAQQKIFDRGHYIGELAWKLFPGGVLVENGYKNPQEAIKRTQELMAQGVPAIYEAAFCYNGILVFVDILEKTPSGWNLVEVKSSGKKIAEIYFYDISIQRYVLTHCGVTPEHCYLMHINSDYFMETDELDLKQFFLLTPMDSELFSDADIEENLAAIEKLLAEEEPKAELDKSGCDGCECHDYCWKELPEDSVFDLLRSNRAREYMAQGILRIADLPPNSFDNEKYNRWVEVCRTQQPYIDKAAVAAWLNKLNYPLYYLDFETTQPVVPLWKYSRPYQQIPFQFSLHVQCEPNGQFEHYEYLSTGKEDPRYGCIKALLEYIGNVGTIIAHNASFEKGRIKEMAHDLPILEKDAKCLIEMTERFADTGDVFKQDYLHPKMHASWSIKKVLPALVPEMSYDGMAVANGGDAMDAFDILYAGKLPPAELEQLRKDLLKYCEQDTWAMVKIVDVLRDSVQ
ncbi:MAG: DUF2779 domain-containing protein [Elusimicrobiaceae bacterium]|nr:DUF2779 domain-containing protein [Elusimicrobiaceae bacterium]